VVRSAEATARVAEGDNFNVIGMCQQQVREWADIPAKYPDAVTSGKHAGPLKKTEPPRGAVLYWSGGSRGHGHVALSLGHGQVRSTDWPAPGRVGTTTERNITRDWNLTYMGWSWEINDVTIPHQEPKPPEPPKPPAGPHAVLNVTHASMQFSDNASQKKADAERVFARAKEKGAAWVTGTEAGGGSGNLRSALAAAAKRNGYRFWMEPTQDAWSAVRETLIRGGWKTYYKKVVDGSAGKFTDKGVLSVGFNTAELGRINVIACHLLTAKYGIDENRKLSRAIGDYARRVGDGSNLVFYGGDQNLPDGALDTFLGTPFTSLWDELGKRESTGHGQIDVIASYDADGRVKGKSINALTDKEFPLYTDHYLVEGAFTVRLLKG
jgi:hypothetical protein